MVLVGLIWALPSCARRAQYGFQEIGYADNIDTYVVVAGMFKNL